MAGEGSVVQTAPVIATALAVDGCRRGSHRRRQRRSAHSCRGRARTARAPDAFTAAVGGEIDATVTQPFGYPRTDEVAALPGVESLDAITFLFASLLDPSSTNQPTPDVAPSPAHGCRPHAWSRDASLTPSSARVRVSRQFATEHQSRLGDHYKLVSWAHIRSSEAGSASTTLRGLRSMACSSASSTSPRRSRTFTRRPFSQVAVR